METHHATDMPVTDTYFELLRDAQTPADVQALMEMFSADEAARKAHLGEMAALATDHSFVQFTDGSLERASDIRHAADNGHQRSGTYDGAGRRA